MKAVSLALVHHPVVNKNGEIIGSAVTNLDLHDIARAAKTFGVDQYYVTTPYEDQQQLVREIVGHWQDGYGAGYNPARKEALSIVQLATSVDEAIEELTERYGKRPLIIVTSAKTYDHTLPYTVVKEKIASGTPVLLLFGTAHGLAKEVMDVADAVLPPIKGCTDYNHLSVRSAVSIILDRLLGS
ncbi:RNA methyltransferase [Desulfosediminicola flagellatus]|uniref:RNA methyltransferase n=1 Tax=Desulfosediminicola flagellatus TaxID=2569541 RepID=UPI0010AC4E8A|nr:RNA methyltransferase [Desulfosediminicola flagellatus]